jgi:hypothetical protein
MNIPVASPHAAAVSPETPLITRRGKPTGMGDDRRHFRHAFCRS